jgi:hypothetical protein
MLVLTSTRTLHNVLNNKSKQCLVMWLMFLGVGELSAGLARVAQQ